MATEDTAQPFAAAETDPNAQLAAAADAFKAFTTGQPVERPRDDRGRFAPTEPAEEIEAEGVEPEAESAEEPEDNDEQPEEAQPEAVEMPSSWSKDDAELWSSLPADAQSKIAAREAERDRAVNQKFQEAASVRKSFEAQLTEANAHRNEYAAAIDQVLSLVTPREPDPRDYGAGTQNYNRDQYDYDLAIYREQAATVAHLQQQRQAIAAQQQREMEAQAAASREAIEEKWRPEFVKLLPDVTDPAKGGAALQSLVEYAVSSGIEPELFQDAKAAAQITSAELLILEKARRYDAIKAAEGKVKAEPKPAPKATPTARPGVAISRSAQQAQQRNKAVDRLAREGSIEAGAAVWKNFL